MLQLTKRTEYGLIALVHMADREGAVVSVREIGDRYPIPRRLLAEVLKDLCRASLVVSQRGASGGYMLVRSADTITLGEIVAALEGRPALSSCENQGPTHRVECDIEGVCPIRSPLQRVRDGIWRLMERTTLRSLVQPSASAMRVADPLDALRPDSQRPDVHEPEVHEPDVHEPREHRPAASRPDEQRAPRETPLPKTLVS